jgi:hypothetical protein
MAMKFSDGLKSFVSSLINRRDATVQNGISNQRLSQTTLREVYLHGIFNKIIRIKAGYALKDTLQFDSEVDERYYEARVAKPIKQAVKQMLAFGRCIVVLHAPGEDLSAPLRDTPDADRALLSVFGGDMVTVGNADRNLQSARYLRPLQYHVRGTVIHWSRVVDFMYVEPAELDAPYYMYGGVSEAELCYDQLIADGVVQRASPKILEKASTLFYKIRGFKDAMRAGQEEEMVQYFGRMEDIRGIHSSGLIDAEDDLEVVQQQISNLADADQITLRRLAMVTGIPLSILVGESVRGLNATGDSERAVFQDMIESFQSDYLLEPINQLMRMLGKGAVVFKDNQGETALDRIQYDTIAIDNAVKLAGMGEDYIAYLEDKGVTVADDFADLFAAEETSVV